MGIKQGVISSLISGTMVFIMASCSSSGVQTGNNSAAGGLAANENPNIYACPSVSQLTFTQPNTTTGALQSNSYAVTIQDSSMGVPANPSSLNLSLTTALVSGTTTVTCKYTAAAPDSRVYSLTGTVPTANGNINSCQAISTSQVQCY